jgi:hypothetical protein
MSSMCRWWLNRQLAHGARADALARIDVAIVVLGVAIAWLLR